MRNDLVLGSWRELGTIGLVAALCGCYAAVLTMTSSVLDASAEDSGGANVGILFGSVAIVFILIAVYISAVVMTNAVDTVIAGRLHSLALLRLLGARSRSLRTAIMRGTAVTGLAGVLVGTVAGTVATDVFRAILVHQDTLPDATYPIATPMLGASLLVVALASTGAGWVGSRAVLQVTPAQALVQSAVMTSETRRTSRIRAGTSLLLVAGGAILLALGAVLGEVGTAVGFVVAFCGSATSGTGLLVGARMVIPRLVAMVAKAAGRGPASRIAGRNAVNDPLRTTRSTMGLIVGVALVTTFASGLRALSVSVDSRDDFSSAQRIQTQQMLTTATAIIVAIVVISSIISAIGFISTMSLTVIQRHREIGLLRALGFTRHQVRWMITFESAALSTTAIGLGMMLGLIYGSLGAQSLIGKLHNGFVWGLPWPYLAAVTSASVLLVLVAARPPAQRAIRVTPIEALRLQ